MNLKTNIQRAAQRTHTGVASLACKATLLAVFANVVSLPALSAVATIAPNSKAIALRQLNDGRLADAIATLHGIVAIDPKDGSAQLLLCRAYFAEVQMDQAIAACEVAVQRLPQSSDAQDWLGRAYGRKADHASPIAGFQLARKVRDAFEAAVQLDPKNPAAVNDLGEYYVGAPPVVGGGLDRAVTLAARVQASLPVEAHSILGRAAEKRRDFGTAEREEIAAIDAAATPAARAGALIDLALYYEHRRDTQKAVAVVQRCLATDTTHGPPTVDAASILADLKVEPELAVRTLQQYIAGSNRTDAAPVVNAYLLLGRLRLAAGDRAGAKIEMTRALELAPDFEPAKQALQAVQ